ncbi:unnamed protein product [Kluyveromyces dobzhanskii CBS 2104]|uniref:Glutathione peroxidase n=1 Tax=Kluyveromyces dobzhanskii CBS 2104 TaxID=1427455 RepID=A0A0A8L1P2_9SACH|nr:unnamed protein product [Kluyveromyces dobzhanskii CBS 2104]
MTADFYSYSCEQKDGSTFHTSELRGKVVLIVNVASKCGFRAQYGDLQKLYAEYHDQGLEILGFPCNQFMNQEPGSDEEIGKFCQDYYGVTFKIMKKCKVNGGSALPLYSYLKEQQPGRFGFKFVRWNFEKFLVDRTGKVHGRYSTLIKPQDLKGDIELLLKAKR